ncbi:MAG: nucleotidyl transferase AbiEii/AbiGii toxin family protein [Oscillospiraceae bacterium]|jgi:hypothetical protein|nr:nucleotidyl transferase AbiEii/AbiGii toxin family protein [Oscillospiraceae bacterium]
MLSNIQRDIIKILAQNRNENSYFAGGSVFNVDGPRTSHDLDIFHPDSDECEKAFNSDLVELQRAGLLVKVLKKHNEPFFAKASVCQDKEATEVDWAFDTGYRFFPAQKHHEFGYVLHEYSDVLVGKILACAGRMVVRDYYDLCHGWQRGLPVVECFLAAQACDPGYSPTILLESISFRSKYRPEMFSDLILGGKELEGKALADMCVWCKTMLISMSRAVITAMETIPFTEYGTLFLRKDTFKAFLPTPEELEKGDFIRNTGRNYAPAFLVEESDEEEVRFGYSF